jgi:hypothetical protein
MHRINGVTSLNSLTNLLLFPDRRANRFSLTGLTGSLSAKIDRDVIFDQVRGLWNFAPRGIVN